MWPNLALQRTPLAFCAGSPRADEEYARVSRVEHLRGAAERGRYRAACDELL